MAKLVILDPELTRGLPPRLTAATGADALIHCLESFTSPVFHPLCDGIALEGIHLIGEALPRAVRNGNDLDARGRMQVAAAMGAVAFQKDLGAIHSLAHPLSTRDVTPWDFRPDFFSMAICAAPRTAKPFRSPIPPLRKCFAKLPRRV